MLFRDHKGKENSGFNTWCPTWGSTERFIIGPEEEPRWRSNHRSRGATREKEACSGKTPPERRKTADLKEHCSSTREYKPSSRDLPEENIPLKIFEDQAEGRANRQGTARLDPENGAE
ncbi:hypothetical protein L3Q82_006236 [Scortum barcoo]|uniref:Uncharacterized protein n=1 Tax=Scortum barcoo TaxID=214431 RepID=A0ACB8X2T5_9TELE|nr:hypothetical protein L3Q82_006236 [Scortum barcoo]